MTIEIIKSKQKNNTKGFTLIELLVVIGILTILLSIVLVAINPARQFSQANDTQRRSDVSALLNAIHQYSADNKGALPAGIGATALNIGSTGVNLCATLVPTYLAQLPVDPTTGIGTTNCATYHSTGYTVLKSGASNRLTVSAPSAEAATISVTR